MRDKLNSLAGGILGLAIMAGMLFLAVLLLKGTAAIGAWALPALSSVAGFAIVFGLPILLILACPRPTRIFAAFGFVAVSHLFGLLLWIYSLLYVLDVWGWLAVIIGLAMAGVGILPIAILASVINAEWAVAGQLVVGIVLTFGMRLFGVYLADAPARESRRQMEAEFNAGDGDE